MNTDRGTPIVRRARPEDKPAVVEFSSKIWEGWDYLPRVYDRWLEDPRGAFLVAELAGQPVGTDKITVLSPGEIWLEGLRVDPDAQGQGVALAINRKAMEIIAGLNPRTVRFATVADNWASRHMGEKDGFRLLFECRRMVAGPPVEKPEPANGLNQELSPWATSELSAGPDQLDIVMDFLKDSKNHRLMRGLYGWGWTFQEMRREFVERVLVRRGGLAIRLDDCIEALALFLPQRHGPRFCLGFIGGEREGMIKLASRFQAVAEERGSASVFAMVPERAVEVLSEAGFRQEYPVGIVVYELSGSRLDAALKEISGKIGSGDEKE
jgi:GNAT superfamily N-acetyltransferase